MARLHGLPAWPAYTTRPHNPRVTSARILLTGFDAFGGESIDPSWQVAEAWHGVRGGFTHLPSTPSP